LTYICQLIIEASIAIIDRKEHSAHLPNNASYNFIHICKSEIERHHPRQNITKLLSKMQKIEAVQ
jgi:hypothetical protein